MKADLLDVSTHFQFGENWAEYSDLIDERRIGVAIDSVRALAGDLKGKTFLDIGSGSGLFSLAALRLGASEVLAIDLDETSVATTRKLLGKKDKTRWSAEKVSVFDLPDQVKRRFDVVYSWGVLHHTGDMWRAVDAASKMVADKGLLVIALYERTPLCRAWTIEKRIYRKLPSLVQQVIRGSYMTAWGAGMLVKGYNPWRRLREGQERGMDVARDAHDWLGGYPYESTQPGEVGAFLNDRGFTRRKLVQWPVRLGGLFGSGCSEYVFVKDR